jgi:transposase-like protein
MGVNYFTNKQLDILRQNPYTKKVSEKAITYTREFKEQFYKEYQLGKLPSKILKDMGIDPKIIGNSRLHNLTSRIKMNESRLEGQEDTRKSNPGRPTTKDLTAEEKVKKLEQKIAYLNQENNFLKKNIQMDKHANSKYKRRQLKNIDSSKK